jgi:hypothetical protein
MKKLLTILLLSLSFPVFCSQSVNIQISGQISKFITVSSSETGASLDLNSDYDTETGNLDGAEYELSLIGVRSNVRDGYTLKASTVNNFKLKSDNQAKIAYSLNLEDAVDTPQGATFSEAESNNDELLSTNGSFSFNGKSDFTLDDENFSDTITLTVTAN